jgi:hypothetical protein
MCLGGQNEEEEHPVWAEKNLRGARRQKYGHRRRREPVERGQERRERNRNRRRRKLQLLPQDMPQRQGIGQIRNQQEAERMPRPEKEEPGKIETFPVVFRRGTVKRGRILKREHAGYLQEQNHATLLAVLKFRKTEEGREPKAQRQECPNEKRTRERSCRS